MKKIVFILFILFSVNNITAANIEWSGLADNNNWNSSGNWTGNQVPGWNDVAVFPAFVAKDCYITGDVYVKGILIEQNYSYTVSVQAFANIVIGEDGIIVNDGVFNLNKGRLVNYGPLVQDINGIFISLDGIIESPSSVAPATIEDLLCYNVSFYTTENKNYHKTLSPLVPVKDEQAILQQSIDDVEEVTVYFDNIGRSEQRIGRHASPSGKDVVSFSQYDQFSRELRMYLPYVSNDCNGLYKTTNLVNDQIAFYTTNADALIAKAHIPADGSLPLTYSEDIYEASPLNRIKESAGPDHAWKYKSDGTGKTLKISRRFNGVNEVLFWNYDKVSGGASARKSTSNTPTYYSPFSLFVTENIGSDNIKTIEYTNVNGQLLLLKTETANNEWQETYYIYDRFGKVRYIIPPMGTSLLNTVNYTIGYEDAFVKKWIFAYKFDARGRLIEKRTPGIEKESSVYDKQDKLILIQNGKQQTENKWSFVKYDVLGRTILSGIYANASSRLTIQAAVDNQTVFAEHKKILPATENYTNNAFPNITANTDILTVNFYDSYDTNLDGTNDYVYAPAGLGNEEPVLTHSIRGMQTLHKERNLETMNWLSDVTFYDGLMRPVQVQKSNHLYQSINTGSEGLTNISTIVLNFKGQPVKSRLTMNHGSGTPITVTNRTVYTPNGNIYRKFIKCNNESEILLTEYQYNEIGKLIDKKIHSEDNGISFLQSIDYRYDIHGWLKSINNSSLTNDMSSDKTNDDNDDLFGATIYREKDFEGFNTPRFGGRISAVKWQVNNPSLTTQVEKAYVFNYTKNEALQNASYLEKQGTSWQVSDRYKEGALEYDKNGNITKLKRYNGGGTGTLIDDLSFSYDGNKILKITENSNTSEGYKTNQPIPSATTFVYNENGSIKEDNQQQIKTDYNLINLPSLIYNTPTTFTINNSYTASGIKLKEVINTSAHTYTKNFTGGATVEGTDDLYFYTSEGKVIFRNGIFRYEYVLQDHIGNARAMFDKGPDGHARLIQENNFYPFGMFHGESPNYIFGDISQVSYGSKELQPYTEEYDFGARNYNPATAHWTSYDPLSEKATGSSPFVYCQNDPITNYDPDGRVTRGEFLYNERQNIFPSQQEIVGMQIQDNYRQQYLQTPEGQMSEMIQNQYTKQVWGDFYEKASLVGSGGPGGSSRGYTSDLLKFAVNLTPVGGLINGIMSFRSGDNVGGMLNFAAVALDLSAIRGAVGTAVASRGSTVERGVVNSFDNTTTIYRNFGPNELASVQKTNGFSITGQQFDGKQFWFTQEGVNWWEGTDFAKGYTAEVVVPSSIINPKSSNYLFLENPAIIDNYPAGTILQQNMTNFNNSIISINIYQVPQYTFQMPVFTYPY